MSSNEPKTTEHVLYLQKSLFANFTFDELLSSIVAHFGEDSLLNEFDISIDRYQTSGCGCHPEDSDYSTYLCITRRLADPLCAAITIQSLVETEE